MTGDMVGDIAVIHDDGTLVAVNDLNMYFDPAFPTTVIRFSEDGAPGLYRASWLAPSGPITVTTRSS